MPSPADYDYALPDELIAQRPPAQRREARLLHLRAGAPLEHLRVDALPRLLAADERRPLVVLNDSKVVPARIYARRASGKRFELLVVDPAALARGGRFHAWIRGAKKLAPGTELAVEGAPLRLRFVGRRADERDSRACVLEIVEGELLAALDAAGELPLPPYIARGAQGPTREDRARYQTVFARDRGSVAAPTAGLHFDAELLAQIDHVSVTLHVGPGTFLPLEAEDVREHRVGAERFTIAADAAARIEAARAEGRPILAVGTTVTRTLESVAAAHEGRIVAGSGSTELVITPGHRFRVVERLLTNFHLPKSSLLMLVCSFAGRERVLQAYAAAVAERYRFYSYGDCMLLDPAGACGA